jgi:hypothetical protein
LTDCGRTRTGSGWPRAQRVLGWAHSPSARCRRTQRRPGPPAQRRRPAGRAGPRHGPGSARFMWSARAAGARTRSRSRASITRTCMKPGPAGHQVRSLLGRWVHGRSFKPRRPGHSSAVIQKSADRGKTGNRVMLASPGYLDHGAEVAAAPPDRARSCAPAGGGGASGPARRSRDGPWVTLCSDYW